MMISVLIVLSIVLNIVSVHQRELSYSINPDLSIEQKIQPVTMDNCTSNNTHPDHSPDRDIYIPHPGTIEIKTSVAGETSHFQSRTHGPSVVVTRGPGCAWISTVYFYEASSAGVSLGAHLHFKI
jgi:hypothetical protein